MVLWFYVQEHMKAQSAVVMILKRLRRRGHDLKSHPTYGAKPGINLPQKLHFNPPMRIWYSKTCLKRSLKKRQKKGPNDKW